jgi:hypothetical protein
MASNIVIGSDGCEHLRGEAAFCTECDQEFFIGAAGTVAPDIDGDTGMCAACAAAFVESETNLARQYSRTIAVQYGNDSGSLTITSDGKGFASYRVGLTDNAVTNHFVGRVYKNWRGGYTSGGNSDGAELRYCTIADAAIASYQHFMRDHYADNPESVDSGTDWTPCSDCGNTMIHGYQCTLTYAYARSHKAARGMTRSELRERAAAHGTDCTCGYCAELRHYCTSCGTYQGIHSIDTLCGDCQRFQNSKTPRLDDLVLDLMI